MNQKIKTILESVLILLLSVLICLMMVQIENLQGTARVINYAGLVRGATQREVKLEITGNPNDELIQYLDDILSGLKYEDGHYDLVSLNDKHYQQKLDTQISYWQKLKNELMEVREKGYENTEVVDMSEMYFHLADETVSAAEDYSEKIATKIRWLEILSVADVVVLISSLVVQSIAALRIAKKNKILEQKAYLDLHTGLPNKSRCEELLHATRFIEEPTACVIFDLNNLKHVNDTMGHSVGDQLIMNFARILRNTVPPKDFVGRYGGDEFMVVLYDADQAKIDRVLSDLKNEIEQFSQYGENTEISYAQGWALSTEYAHCTLRSLFDKADQFMYENKQRSKMGRQD